MKAIRRNSWSCVIALVTVVPVLACTGPTGLTTVDSFSSTSGAATTEFRATRFQWMSGMAGR